MNTISLNPSAIARTLAAVAVLLVLAGIAGQFSKLVLGHESLQGLVPLFDLDDEQNIPSYFSTLLILFAALLLAVIAKLSGKQGRPDVSKWAILSIGFLYMAFDEAFEVHERLVEPVRALLGDGQLGFLFFAWVIPAMALILVLGLFFMRFVAHLPAKPRLRFLLAAGLYLGGVIGIELIGGRYAEMHGEHNWTYSLIATVEESLEMAGLIVFIWALLKYCADEFKEVQWRFET